MLIKAITHHSKWSQTRIFHCSSSRGFCTKGVHFNKAGKAHWKQLLSYFSASHKCGWSIFLSFAEALIRGSRGGQSWNTAIDVTTGALHLRIFPPRADVLLYGVLETNYFISQWENRGVCLTGTDQISSYKQHCSLLSSGLEFATGLTWAITSLIQKTEGFTWSINFSGLIFLLFTQRRTSYT